MNTRIILAFLALFAVSASAWVVAYPPVYFPYCGNGICEWGEDFFNCPFDCALFWPRPFLSSCSLTSYPSSVAAGSSATIAVNYFNTPYEPLSTLVNCGNGQYSVAYGCYGFTGACFAVCQYPQAGTYTATAMAGGVFCSSTSMGVSGYYGGTGGSTTTGTTTSESCSVSPNPSYIVEQGTSTATVTYTNYGSSTPQGTIDCGNGQTVAAACTGTSTGSCIATCNYTTPNHYPATYAVGAVLNGRTCTAGRLTVAKSTNPGTLTVNVVNRTYAAISGAAVEIDGAVRLTDGNGSTSFNLIEGTYDVRASKEKYGTAVTTTNVYSNNNKTITIKIEEQFSSSCSITASPETIRGGSSSAVTVAYEDMPSAPSNVLLSCGNGQTVSAQCSGNPQSGSCSASCFYPEELDEKTYTISSTMSGKTCTTKNVKVVKALPSTGVLYSKVSSCATGESLNGAEVRIINPINVIPTNYTGDGTYNLSIGQTVRADNGFIVQLYNSTNTTGTISILTSQGYLITQGTASQGQTVSTTNVEATVTNTTNVNATNNTVIIRVASLTSQPQPSTYFTDAFGEAKAEINPGTYNVQYYKSGYNATNSTAIISRATTTTKSICLEPVTCDFSVEMLSAPTCGYQNDYYQVRIVNKVNETKNVSLTYSTSEIDGPMSVVLAPKESTIVNMKARSANPIISGQSLGIVNFRGGNACMQSYTLPLCTAQEITLSAPQNKISTPPGKTSCASVIARNRAKENAVVTMTSASTTTSLKTTISPDTFQLTPLETKNLDVCITPPAGFSGTATVTLKASSAFGESNATLQVDSMGQGFYYADFNSCPIIDASKTTSYTITLRNSGEDGDYTLALEDNPLAVKREYALPQFQKDTARAIVLQLEPQDVKAGEVRFNAYLKKEGFTVFQQGLCFDIRGTTVVSAELAENSIDVRKGQTRATFITVRNFGSLKSKYTVQVGSTPLNVKATPMTFILNPREEQVVEVTVGSSEAMTTQTYSVPIQIYADATVSTTAQNHEVTLQCGNGQTSAISCPAGRGTCTATCTYGTEGFFTPSATIAGISCSTASATVRSLSTLQNKCTLYASPNSVERGATLTVTANYNQLPSTLNGSIQINCGNGQSSTANNCNGQTGACTATCTYANEGNYIVSATAANTACEDARVAVTNPSAQTCSIASSPNNIVKGESTSVVLRYSGLPVTGTTTQTQYYQVLSDTENLLVNVVSKSAAISLSTAELTVAGIAPQQVLLGATAQIPVTVKNENYFTIDNVLVYASNLPSGVIATPPTKFGLGPGEQKTVYVRIEATPSAELGTTQIKIHSESALTQATANSVFLSVLLSGENQINAGIKLTVTPTEDGKAFAVSAKITNKEPEAFTVTASMALPEGWSYSMQPQSTSVLPSGEEEIQGIITPFAYDPAREYDATMVLQTKDGRIMKLPFKVTREGGSILAGLVTSEETAALIGIAIALFLVAAAAFFLAARHQHKRR